MKVRIKELKKEDLDKDLRPLGYIVQMHHAVYANSIAESWTKRLPILKRAYNTGRYGLIVAFERETDTPVGFLDYWIIHCFIENMSIALLQNMRVIKHHRGKGIGTLLVKKLRDISLKKRVEEIHVVAGPGADLFYEKFGFKKKDKFLEVRVDDMVV